jgi:hypothetical protein
VTTSRVEISQASSIPRHQDRITGHSEHIGSVGG